MRALFLFPDCSTIFIVDSMARISKKTTFDGITMTSARIHNCDNLSDKYGRVSMKIKS